MNDKQCTRCKQIKPHNEFYETISRGHKYATANCIPCHNKTSKESHDKRMTTDVRYKVIRLLRTIKQRSEKLNVPFDLDLEWVLNKYENGRCEVSGIPLSIFDHSGVGNRPWGASLDRVDPTKGYVKENVRLVCWIYNRAKGSGTHDDLMKLVKALAANDNRQ